MPKNADFDSSQYGEKISWDITDSILFMKVGVQDRNLMLKIGYLILS